MAIPLGGDFKPGAPVVKRTALGQTFKGAVVNVERRNRQRRKDDGSVEVMTRDDGRPKQELIVTCLTMPGSDAPAGIGDEQGIAQEGDTVRLILKGKSFADWIQAERDMGRQLQVGDFVTQVTDSAQVYDANGNAKGKVLTTQAEIDAVPRSASLGIYSTLKLEQGSGEWVDKAEAAYRAEQAIKLNPNGVADQRDLDEEPW